MDIPLGKWTPDLGVYGNPGLIDIVNGVPMARGWEALPSPMIFDPTPLPGDRPRILRMDKGSTGGVDVFGFSGPNIYSLNPPAPIVPLASPGWQVRSKAGGYTTPSDGTWRTTRFADMLIATNFTDPVQVVTVGAGGLFADLGPAAEVPKARFVATIRSQVMLGNLDDPDDGLCPYRLRWSQWNAPRDFAYSRRYQSDFQDVYDLGQITGLTGGAFGLVLLENGLARATYIGPPWIYQFDTLQYERGCNVPTSVIRQEANTYWWSPDGWQLYDGQQVRHIGAGKVDKWFSDQLDLDYQHLMCASVDPGRPLIYWLFCGPGHAGVPNRMLIHNMLTGDWGRAEINGWVLGRFGTPGLSLEDLDNYFASIDAVPGSLDDAVYAGSDTRQLAMLTDTGVEVFGGPSMPAYFETGEVPGNGRQFINEAVFNGEADIAQVALRVGWRQEPSAPVSWSPYYKPSRSSLIKPRREGRNLRFGLQLLDGWKSATSITAEIGRRGGR